MNAQFPDALRGEMPEGLMDFIDKMIHKRNDQLFGATPSDLQMVIIVLRQGGQQAKTSGPANSGVSELRAPMAPLSKNAFAI